MKWVIITALVALVSTQAFGQSDDDAPAKAKPTVTNITLPPSLFVQSFPLRAHLKVDGEFVSQTTPALLRGLSAGRHTIVFYKDGYQTHEESVEIKDGKPSVLKVSLVARSTAVIFPQNERTLVAGEETSTAGKQFRFQDGTYTLSSDGSAVRLEPSFPDEQLLTISAWSLPMTVATSGLITFDGISRYRQFQEGPSLSMISSWVLSVANVAWFLSLVDRKNRFVQERAPLAQPQAETADFSSSLFQTAQKSLQDGNLTEAIKGFAQLIRDYPDASFVPEAWFRMAQVHTILGNRSLAKGEYRLLVDFYPQVEWYDKSVKALSDLEAIDGNAISALYYLNQLTFLDDTFNRSDIESAKQALQAKIDAVPEVAP